MKKIAFLTLLSLLSFLSFSQSVFNRVYFDDSLNNNYGYTKTVIQSSDGNYLVSAVNENQDIISAIKLNSQGDTIWTYTPAVPFGVQQLINSTIEATDGNFVLGGEYGNLTNGDRVGFLAKISSQTGEQIWKRDIGEIHKEEQILSIKETADKGFVLAGNVFYSNTIGDSTYNVRDALLVKTDSLGQTEFKKYYGGADTQEANSVEITEEGGFILLGSIYGQNIGSNFYAVKTDSLGNMLWQKFYGGNYQDYGFNIRKLQDGNYALVGWSQFSFDSTGSYIAKIDPDGFVLWEKTQKGSQMAQSFTDVDQLPNGNIVACGYSYKNYQWTRLKAILKSFNPSDGSLVWEKEYKYKVIDSIQTWFSSIDVCNDGGIVLAGYFLDYLVYPNYRSYVWVVKTDCRGNATAWSNTCSQAGIEEFNDEVSPTWFTLYPNPTTSNFSVQCTLPDNSKNNTISIYDAMGKLMQIFPISDFSNTDVEIDASGFSAGVYSIVLSSDKQILQTQKLVRMD